MDNVTLVTAVNKKYLEKFKKNFPIWGTVDLIADIKSVIVFAHKDCIVEIEKLLGECASVDVIEWSFPKAESEREEMLTAFVHGVAEHVKTKWWIKLDCDTKPKSIHAKLPDDWQSHTMCGHKWGYTKIKSDPKWEKGLTEHWLNRLDSWADCLEDFKGTNHLFDKKITTARHGHSRTCSFFAIEKTGWTRHLSQMCNKTGGRMPVPSQDTLTWYGITRMGGGRTVLPYNFKRYWSP